MLTDDFYWFWLCSIPGIGNRKIKKLLTVFQSPQEIYKAGQSKLSRIEGITDADAARIIAGKKDIIVEETYRRLQKQQIHFVHMRHPDYPQRLLQLYDPPAGLYYKGRLPKEERISVAVVGSRACSEYGKHIAYRFGREFAGMDFQVISGLAVGIDAAAHSGCLDGGGYTCAVMGCGADICYPKENIALYEHMSKEGCILSEYIPGTKPYPGQFPVRNRIISGLADIVVVVEARKKSGSLITVDQALEQNKEVYAVPGRVTDVLSEGCNELIKMGAMMITQSSDLLLSSAQLRNHLQKSDKKENKNQPAKGAKSERDNLNFAINPLATKKNMVYSGLGLLPKSLDGLIEETGLGFAEVSEQLLCLQLEGLVREVAQNCYVRTDE